MSALIGLLQGEIRGLLSELQDCTRQSADVASADAALARWNRRAQALVGALSVLGRETYSTLAQALHKLSQAADLQRPEVAQALALYAAFAELEADRAEHWLVEHSSEAQALATALAEAPAMKTPEADSNPLQALFRQEVEDQCARMAQQLLRLEQEPERLELIAPIMRSAHSVKGAAKAVRLDAAVSVAHALEDRLAAAQRQGSAVSESLIEYALGGVDLLRLLARDGATTALLARRDGFLQAREDGVVATGADAAAQPSYIAAEDGDPVLRIKASLVGKLIALAGSGVVGAHRLRPYAERQQRMRQSIAQLGRLVDDLHHRLGAPAQTTPLGGALAEIRRQLSDTRRQTQGWIDDFSDYARAALDLNERIYQAASMTRLRPFRDLVLGYPRMVRDLARQLGKRARLTVAGEGLEVDRDVMEKLDAPLTHLLRNALDHGIESPTVRRAAGKSEEGQLRIWATHRAGMLAIDVSDDGVGIDVERVRQRLIDSGRYSAEAAAALSDQAVRNQLFAAGFSTRNEVTEVSGRGVGLDVVRESIERLDGSVRLSTRPGAGTTFHLLVPISRAVTRSLAVRCAGEVYAFPSLRIDRVVRSERAAVVSAEGLQYLPVHGRNVGLVPLAELLDLGSTRVGGERIDVVMVEHQGRMAGFVVDELLGEYDLATRPLDPRLGRVADVGAVALLPDGTPVVLLDADDLMRSALTRERASLSTARVEAADPQRRKRVLIADDSISVRELERQLLLGRGFEVEVAVDGMDAWTRLRDENFDLLITDVDMPRMNGIELTRSIKQDPRLRSLPVVIVSYRDRPEDRRRGLEVRADSYLTKSDFQDEGFLRLVHQLIGDAQGGP
ncbi:MAG: response regulator [Lysobacterales bacterium]